MPGISSPSPQLYSLGRGILSIGEWNGTTPPTYPGGFVDVGNCPRFEVEVTEEKLEHFSSRSGTRLKDKVVILETGYTLNFDFDEISVENLKVFLKGTLSGYVISANQALDREYAVRFVSDNPVGPNEKWEFHRTQLSPGGPFNLISDEWGTLTFAGDGLADTANHATSPFFTVTYASTTTTTTT
jgi:hypothetical protein